MSDAYKLIVTVSKANDVEIRMGENGVRTKGKVNLDPVREGMLTIFEDWLCKGKISEEEEVKVLGTILYEAIFDGNVGNFFETKLDEFESRSSEKKGGERCHIELVFEKGEGETGEDGLADRPWEFMYYPKDDTPLATKANIVLSRHEPTHRNRENLEPPPGTLKILIVVAELEEFFRSDDAAEAEKYKKEFATSVEQIGGLWELAKNSRIEVVGSLNKPTFDELEKALDDYKPHVVHYIGFGRQKGEIALLKAGKKEAEWCTGLSFAGCFEKVQPQLVFLHLCQGAQKKVDANYLKANFAVLAPALIRKRIQAVVAMRYPIRHESARQFTEEFYKSLSQGKSVATAVQEGRRRSARGGIKDSSFGSLVLFMHSQDGRILNAETSTPTSLTTAGNIAQPSQLTNPIKANAAPETNPPAPTNQLPTDFFANTSTSAPATVNSSPADQVPPTGAAPRFSFDDLADAAFEARTSALTSSRVSREVELLRIECQDKSAEVALGIIERKILSDLTADMVPVYAAMRQKLKSFAG